MNVVNRMEIVQIALRALFVLILWGGALSAHTPEETNDVVRALLVYCARQQFDNSEDRPDTVLDTGSPYVFFNKIAVKGGWTAEGKMAAFNAFLEEMGTFDFNGKDKEHCWTASLAVDQCSCMNYTNALPAIRRLALNPTYPSSRSRRWNAIEFTIEQMGPSDETTRFVETILTNQTVFTLSERGCASGLYIHSLLTNAVDGVVLTNAVNRLYSVREQGVAGGYMLDKLFVRNIEGFEFSSNRLAYAEFVLSSPECDKYDRRDFTEITNRLHSSGQPLRWINVGGTNE